MKPICVVCSAIAISAALCLAPMRASAQGRAPAEAKKTDNAPTPKAADGHPDLNGIWGGGGGGGEGDASGFEDGVLNFTVVTSRDASLINFERDNTILRRMDVNKPIYKPQFWEKVQKLDQTEDYEDPEYACFPDGVPRMGPPNKIVQLPKELIFLYANRNTFRVIPMDGRPHTPDDQLEGTWNGEPRGSWDGDTLVIDSTGFIDASWLAIGGYFHSDNMHVVERIKRTGNTLTWQATVEDPDTLIKPWVMNPVVRKISTDPNAELEETLPCSEHDRKHLVTHEHH